MLVKREVQQNNQVGAKRKQQQTVKRKCTVMTKDTIQNQDGTIRTREVKFSDEQLASYTVQEENYHRQLTVAKDVVSQHVGKLLMDRKGAWSRTTYLAHHSFEIRRSTLPSEIQALFQLTDLPELIDQEICRMQNTLDDLCLDTRLKAYLKPHHPISWIMSQAFESQRILQSNLVARETAMFNRITSYEPRIGHDEYGSQVVTDVIPHLQSASIFAGFSQCPTSHPQLLAYFDNFIDKTAETDCCGEVPLAVLLSQFITIKLLTLGNVEAYHIANAKKIQETNKKSNHNQGTSSSSSTTAPTVPTTTANRRRSKSQPKEAHVDHIDLVDDDDDDDKQFYDPKNLDVHPWTLSQVAHIQTKPWSWPDLIKVDLITNECPLSLIYHAPDWLNYHETSEADLMRGNIGLGLNRTAHDEEILKRAPVKVVPIPTATAAAAGGGSQPLIQTYLTTPEQQQQQQQQMDISKSESNANANTSASASAAAMNHESNSKRRCRSNSSANSRKKVVDQKQNPKSIEIPNTYYASCTFRYQGQLVENVWIEFPLLSQITQYHTVMSSGYEELVILPTKEWIMNVATPDWLKQINHSSADVNRCISMWNHCSNIKNKMQEKEEANERAQEFLNYNPDTGNNDNDDTGHGGSHRSGSSFVINRDAMGSLPILSDRSAYSTQLDPHVQQFISHVKVEEVP
jgi:hypothetical protein